VYLVPEKQEQLERITHYLKEAYIIPEVRNFSVVMGLLIDTFEELFLEDNTLPYYERLADLKERQSSKDVLFKELKLLAKQLDLI
ncbi:hypothetical protein ACQ0P6_03205, partial [Streptococcus canis]